MSPAAPETLLQAIDVSVRFTGPVETVVAVDHVSLSISAGEATAIVGPSGAGKTTLLDLLIGWRTPDDGRMDRAENLVSGWAGIAVVPQSIGLLEELTLEQNIELPTRLGLPARWSTAELAAELGISELVSRLPSEVSQGEQQRASLARALAVGPQILIADEPTAHQDDHNAQRVAELLATATRSGTAIVVATHDERLLEHFGRVVHLRDGSVES